LALKLFDPGKQVSFCGGAFPQSLVGPGPGEKGFDNRKTILLVTIEIQGAGQE
jgi:hypothetical protein